MDRQLEWIASIFKESQVNYWIDSGTLLGIIREKKIIDSDNDLDIAIWHYEVDKVLKLFKIIKKGGYRIRKLYYSGNIVKIKCIPKKNIKKRIIDISVFKRSFKGYAWSPQVVEKNFKSVILKAIKRVLMFFWLYIVKTVNIDRIPWIYIIDIYTWWIPEDFFNEVVLLEDFNIYVPNKYLAYLIYRYGNWQIPNPNWSFIKDDTCLNKLPPEILI